VQQSVHGPNGSQPSGRSPGRHEYEHLTAFNNGAQQTLPLNFNANPMTMAGLDTIQAVLSLQAATIDLKTRTKPTTTLVTTVRLNNCSMASAAQQTSCE
jgi:hypothetical protein